MTAPSFHPVEAFLEQVPVDRRRVMSEARHLARRYRRRHPECSLRYCATEGLDHAQAREESRRATIANGLYVASLDPLERERVACSVELCLLRNKFIGCLDIEREQIASKMAALSVRIAEIEAMQSERRAA